MAATKIPAKTLVSFGSMVFTGTGIPANVLTDTTAVNATPEVDRPRHNHATNPYGISLRGYSAGIIKPYTSAWTITVVATPGLSEAASFQAIETAYATWYALWLGTHTHRTVAGTTGQLGDLIVLDAFGTSYKAEAELSKFPFILKPGEVMSLQIAADFVINEDWA
ncbi:MAG: hypothetical protein LC769_07300 [Chloroflexi bacterium]|nr:hypothetical protein [Chloroflexota bacterium]